MLSDHSDEEIYLIWCYRQKYFPSKEYIHDQNRVWVKTKYNGNNESVIFTHDGKWESTCSTLNKDKNE